MLHQKVMKDDVHFHKASVRSFTKNKQDTRVYIIYQLFLSFHIRVYKKQELVIILKYHFTLVLLYDII